MKKIVQVIIGFLVLIGITVPVLASDWFDRAFDYCLNENIILYEEYDTEGSMTRGGAADLLVNVLRKYDFNRYYPENPFYDLRDGEQDSNDLVRMYYMGIFNGAYDEKGDLLAMKDSIITREQAAAVLVRMYGFHETGAQVTFTDEDMISGYAVKDVETCVSLGIISGYEDHTFRPQEPVSKQEFIEMLYKADEANGGKSTRNSVSPITEDMISKEVSLVILNEDPIDLKDDIQLKFINRSDAEYIYNIMDFQLEKKENENWVVQHGGFDIDDVGMIINADAETNNEICLYNGYNDLTSGEYRMVYGIIPDQNRKLTLGEKYHFKEEYCIAEFNIA